MKQQIKLFVAVLIAVMMAVPTMAAKKKTTAQEPDRKESHVIWSGLLGSTAFLYACIAHVCSCLRCAPSGVPSSGSAIHGLMPAMSLAKASR